MISLCLLIRLLAWLFLHSIYFVWLTYRVLITAGLTCSLSRRDTERGEESETFRVEIRLFLTAMRWMDSSGFCEDIRCFRISDEPATVLPPIRQSLGLSVTSMFPGQVVRQLFDTPAWDGINTGQRHKGRTVRHGDGVSTRDYYSSGVFLIRISPLKSLFKYVCIGRWVKKVGRYHEAFGAKRLAHPVSPPFLLFTSMVYADECHLRQSATHMHIPIDTSTLDPYSSLCPQAGAS